MFLGGVFVYDMVVNFEIFFDVFDGENSCFDYVFYFVEMLVVIDY